MFTSDASEFSEKPCKGIGRPIKDYLGMAMQRDLGLREDYLRGSDNFNRKLWKKMSLEYGMMKGNYPVNDLFKFFEN